MFTSNDSNTKYAIIDSVVQNAIESDKEMGNILFLVEFWMIVKDSGNCSVKVFKNLIRWAILRNLRNIFSEDVNK